MLNVTNLCRVGLGPISFSVEKGNCLAVMGPSGAGKTLLLRAIADLDPNQGEVTLDGANRSAMQAPAWRRRVGLLPAENGWWADRVGDHFTHPDSAASGLTALGLPEGALDWTVSRTSTGERHRLALLRMLENRPDVLLLDEPTAALDPDATGLVEAVLHGRLEVGAAIVLVTHDARQAERLAATTLNLRGGQIAKEA